MVASQMRTLWSSAAVSRRVPSGLQATALMDRLGPASANSSVPRFASQTRAVPSCDPDRSRVPSGLQATPHNASKWPAYSDTSRGSIVPEVSEGTVMVEV